MKHLNALIVFLFILLIPFFISAQPWMQDVEDETGQVNFFKIQNSFEEYIKNIDITQKGSGYKPFKRWEYYWESRVDKDGHFPSPGVAKKSWESYLKSHPEQAIRSLDANWISEGPTTSPGGYAGLGRVNVIEFDPLNSNIVWAGTPSGGLWKSTDNGISWTTSTDDLQVLGASGIAIHPTTPDIMYISTGDSDGGDTYSLGVLKSIDGGSTWNTTGLTWVADNYIRIRKLLMDPDDPNMLIAAASNGLHLTTDAGVTWTNVLSGDFYDIESHPTASTNIFYASKNDYSAGGNIFYKSTDNGATWTLKTTAAGGSIGRAGIAISAASPNTVYNILWDPTSVAGTFAGIYKSTDSGETWTLQSTTPSIFDGTSDGSGIGNQGYYDFVLTADPTNADILYAGGVAMWKSLDAGVTWTLNNFWYNLGNGTPTIHADKHAFKWQNNTTLWNGNDGGVYMTDDGGASWNYRSEGMAISQIYRLSASQTDNKVIIGLQDNGTKLKNTSGIFTDEIGGDGLECIIDPTNSSRMFGAIQNGELRRTLNGGISWEDIQDNIPGAPAGAWLTPYALDPVSPTTVYAGYGDLWKSTDSGDSWTNIGAAIGANNNVNVAPSNPDYIYAGSTNSLMRTTDGGSNWTAVTMPGNDTRMLEIHPTNPDILWAVRQYYSSGQKVYKSIDGGATWTNISGTLPNLPANCIIYDKNSVGGLYIGMDIGIYYRDDSMSDWELFSNGIPNVEIWDLSINYMEQRIYAGSYGRGLWSSNLKDVNFIVSGEKNICPDLDWTYAVDNVATATNYIWTLPSGWTGSSSTNSIDVDPSSTSATIQCEVVIPTGNRIYTLAVNVNTSCETAINFDGTDDYAEIQSGVVDVSNSSFTVEFWAKKTALGETDYVASQGSSGTNVNLHIGFRSSNSFTFAFYANDLNANSAFTDLEWHHWACVYDNTISSPDHNRFIYRDGKLIASDRTTSDYLGTGSLMIGRNGSSYMEGDLDEFRVWNTARTQSEIEENLHCVITSPPASLIAYLPFEDGIASGDNVFNYETTDFSGNGNDALLNNLLLSGSTSNFVDGTKPKTVYGPDVVCPDLVWEFSVPEVNGAMSYTWSLPSGWTGSSMTKEISVSPSTTSGTVTCSVVASCGTLVFTKAVIANSECGNSLNFDGVDDYVQFSDNSVGNFGTGEFTIEYWVKTTDDKGGVIAKRNSCDCDNWSALIENGRIRLEISDDGCTTAVTNVYGVSKIDDGEWHHIAFTRVGTTIYAYVDGRLEVKGISAHDMTSTNSLRIGNIPCSTSWHLDGSVDEVRIWNIARTKSEIQDNMFGLFTASNANLQLYMPFEDGLLEGDNSGHSSTIDHSMNKLTGVYTNMAKMGTSSNMTYDVDVVRYLDADMDGFGISGTSTTDFNQSGSYSMLDGDCNDGDGGINPCAIEICGNSIDDDCDGNTDIEVNRALDLNGASDRINIPTLAHTSSFTFEAWIKVNSTSTGTQLINEWYGTNRADIRIHGDGYLTYRENGGGFTYSATDLRDDIWHHIAVTHEGYAGNNVKLYLDGSLFRTLSFSTVVTSNLNTIGSDRIGGNPLLGAIDDVRFWDVALTEEQISERMNVRLDGNETNLVRYYPMDQGIPDGDNSGVVLAKDWTSGSQDGTLLEVALTGMTSNWVAGKSYPTIYPDTDNDTFGANIAWTCGSMTGFITNNLDCDDTNNAINPFAEEVCGNGIDDNCDGDTDLIVNKALHFSDAGEDIDIPNVPHTEFFTVEAWIKVDPADSGLNQIIKWRGANPDATFGLSSANLIAYFEGGSGFHGGDPLNDGLWHHVALVHNGYSGTNIFAYVDGVQRMSASLGSNIATTITLIGNSFKGHMDDVRFWNTVLTKDQIVSRMNLRLDGTEPNLVRYYPFDHGQAGADNSNIDKAIDRSSNGMDGTLSSFALTGTTSNWVSGRPYPTLYSDGDSDGFAGSTAWTCGSMAGYYPDNSDCNDAEMALNPGVLEICGNGVDENCNGTSDENSLSLNFDGADDKVSFGNTLGNFGTGDFTIEFKIKTVEADDYIISKRPTCSCDNLFNMEINGDGKAKMTMYEDGSCNNGGAITGTSVLTDGTWHHIAFVRQSGSGYLVVDGVVEASGKFNTNINNTADFEIGNNPCGFRFKGELDELRVWNIARPIAAIDNMRNAVINSTNPDLLAYYGFDTELAVGGGTNTGLTTLVDLTGNGNTGTLNNFNLSGTTSNYLNNPGTTLTWYADTDSDNYGDPNVSVESCSQPSGYVEDNTDCDDTTNAINPGVSEILGNSIDDDCDGAIDEEASIRWVLLDNDVNGTCTSNTDCCTNTFCFGLEYTPGANGTLAAYTSGFFVDCIGGANPIISNASCIMTNNSSETEECSGPGTILINASGNNGSTALTVETPIIIHQICITIPDNTSINLTEDIVTDISISIDLDGGGAIDEFPAFTATTATGNTPPLLTMGSINSCYTDLASAEAAAIAATSATDVCDSSVDLIASTVGTCSATITVTGTDDCGLFSTVTYSTAIDGDGPTADALTDITGIKCIAAVPVADINLVMNEADNCGGGVTVSHEGDTNNSGAGCAASPYIVTRTYRLTDGCGNTTDLTQTITVIDDVNPTADALTDITGIKCIAAVPAADINLVMNEVDNCGGSVTVSHEGDTNNSGAGCAASPYIVTRTYRLTDGCGNTTDLTQMITVMDDVAPTADALIDITGIKCIVDVPSADINLVMNEADNCGGSVTVSHEGDTNNSGTGCAASPFVVTRTYRLTDGCGNTTDLTQTITVIDDEAPIVGGSLTDVNIEGCGTSDAPTAVTNVADLIALTGNLSVSDGCTSNVLISVTHSDISNGSCPIVITRTYSIKDACLNESTAIQLINIDDTTIPSFTAPTDITIYMDVSCDFDSTTTATGMATSVLDNCTMPISATYSDIADLSGCNGTGTINRVWSLVDDCGNMAANQMQIITVSDTLAPTFTPPANITIALDNSCNYDASIGVTGDVTDEADNCGIDPFPFNGGNGIGSQFQQQLGGFEIFDHFEHDHAPDVPCINVAQQKVAFAETNKNIERLKKEYAWPYTSRSIMITLFDWPLRQAAGWNYNDYYIISNYVDQDPTAGIQDYNCGMRTYNGHNGIDIVAFPFSWHMKNRSQVEVIAGADGVIVNKNDGEIDTNCSTSSLPANFVFLEHADGSRSYYYHMKLGSVTTKPIGAMVAKGEYLGVVASSGSSTAPHLHFEVRDINNDVIEPFAGVCNNKVNGTTSWWAAQKPYREQTILHVETQGDAYQSQPCPTPAIIDKQDIFVPGELAKFWISGRDLLAASVSTMKIKKPDNSVWQEWTYSPNNDSGAVNLYWAYFMPNEPGNWTFEASIDGGTPVSHSFQVFAATLEASFTDVIDLSGCGGSGTITRTWSLSDCSGNTTTHDQIITIEDQTNPTATPPSNITGIKCIADVPAVDLTLVDDEADNCGTPTVTHQGDSNNGGTGCMGNAYIVTRTYRITDDCGNFIDVSHTITVIDDVGPSADALADMTGIKCIADVPVADTNLVMNESDNCSGSVTVTHDGDSNNGGTGCSASPYIVTRTYRLTDACGNTTDLTQTITVIDDVAPTGDALSDITDIKCLADVPAADTSLVMNEADNCGGSVTVSHEGDSNNGGAGCMASPYIVTRIYRLTDACGNFTDLMHTITVIDDVVPTADALTDMTGIKCITDIPAIDTDLVLNESDNCGGSVTVTHESDSNNGGSGCTASPYIVTRTYRVTDACGNFIDLSQTITVIDDEIPAITGSIATSVIEGCDASAAPSAETSISGLEGLMGDLEVADGCTDDTSLALTHADVLNGTCPLTITRTYTIKDACDNTSTVDHIIMINDTTAPVLVLGTINACYLTIAEAITAAESATNNSDNCPGSVTISSTSLGTCPTEIVVKGTDMCGNVDSVAYSVVITNGVIPTENGGPVPIDSSIQVALDAVPPTMLPEIIDVCGNILVPGMPVIGGTYQTGDCIGTITYTYTYVDCTNTSLDWTFTYNLSCQKINIRGLVEGAYEPGGDTLRTDYNNLHLLPGQDKLLSGNLSVIIGAPFTPFGQPYQAVPWNYTGNLGDTYGEQSSPNAPANVKKYPNHVFDWILVTIRENGIEVADNIFQCAGWLHKDGEVSFPESCPDDFTINTGSEYYVVLEHRNHLAVLDTATIMDSGAYIDIDFSLQDSYAPTFRQGQIEIEAGVFGMYGANTDQELSRVSINSVDRTNWKIDQNKIGYFNGDINQNVSTNSEDETKWKQNQNTTSGIKFD